MLCTKNKQSFKYTSGTPLQLCSSTDGGAPGNTGPNPPYAYVVVDDASTPCSISDVCSNGALCASNWNNSTPYCTNNSNKTCDSSLDWYAACGSSFTNPPISLRSNCDKNGENCRPTCF